MDRQDHYYENIVGPSIEMWEREAEYEEQDCDDEEWED